MAEFYSQAGQDYFLENNIFKGYKNGIFMDVGAHNGVNINNTLFFEKNHGWTGINIEPIKEVFDKLMENRPKCTNLNCAIDLIDGTAEFVCNTGYTEMLSGLKNQYDPRHRNRMKNELKRYGGSTNIIQVQTKRIETICDEYNTKHINYLSIDVEGAEFNVIKSINFDKVFIDVIGFENNFYDKSLFIIAYLQEKGYKMVHNSQDIFMIHKNSDFNKTSQ